MKHIIYMLTKQPLGSVFIVIVLTAILMFSLFVLSVSILQSQSMAQAIAMFIPGSLLLAGLIWSGEGENSGITVPPAKWAKHWRIVTLVMSVLVITVVLIERINLSELAFNPSHAIDFAMQNAATGFLEEILFRGVCFYLLYRAWGSTRKGLFIAAATQTLLFGLLHLGNIHRSDLIEVVYQVGYSAFIGFGFAGLVAYSRSIWPAVTLHIFINSASSLDNFFAGPAYSFSATPSSSLLLAVVAFFLFGFLPGIWCLRHAPLAMSQQKAEEATS